MSFMPNELSVVRLNDGRVGTVVSVRKDAGTVEICDAQGRTIALVDIDAWDIDEIIYEYLPSDEAS